MKTKSNKEKEFSEKKLAVNISKTSSQKKGEDIETKSSKSADDDEDDVVVEDDWGKIDEEDNDPDFEEFDIPKSQLKKPSAKKGKKDEDFYIDEKFKDMDLFNDDTDVEEEDDDF